MAREYRRQESDSSDSNTEDELLNIIQMLPRPKIYGERNDPLDIYDDFDFKERCRFSKDCVQQLMRIFNIDDMAPLCNRNFPISPLNQLLITLRYYATGSFQQVIADHINVHKSSVCRIIERITIQIARLSSQFITMPRGREAVETMKRFYEIKRFPRVIGAIDCTHIKIISPGGENAELFRNRKGWFSINTQVVCDSDLQIRDIVARWSGSVHDSRIFNNSALRAKFENDNFPNCWLLGDSGYAYKSYLLTPVLNPVSRAENKYNTAHIQTRNTVQRTFGVWKRRFPCLSLGMRMKPEKVVKIIVATAVLHNIAVMLKDDVPDFTADEILENVNIAIVEENRNVPVRTALINTVFSES